MFRTLLMLALLAAPGLARADDDDDKAIAKAKEALAKALKDKAEKAARIEKEKTAYAEKVKAANAEKEKAARAAKDEAAAIEKYKTDVAGKEKAGTQKTKTARVEKVKAASDDKLAVLEEKLQALLKEIQALKGDKAERKKWEKKVIEPKAGGNVELKFELKDGKLTAPKATAGTPLHMHLELKDGKLTAPKAATGPLRFQVEMKDGGKPQILLIGPDGKAKPIDVDSLKDLQKGGLEKLKDLNLKFGELKIDGFEKIKELADVEKLKGAIKGTELEKLKGFKIEVEKAKGPKGDDSVKPKTADKVNIDKLKAMGAEGNRIVVVDGATGRVIRTEEPPAASKPTAKSVTGTVVVDGAAAKSVTRTVVLDGATGKVLRVSEPLAATPAPAPSAPTPAPPVAARVAVPATPGAKGVYSYSFSGDSGTISLTRAAYSLSGEQAQALADFLKAFVKAQVLETKVEGGKLVVTTTPDVQSTIGQVVGLMTGKSAAGGTYRLSVSPAAGGGGALFAPTAPRAVTPPAPVKAPMVAKPAKPSEPAKPAKPAKPAEPKKEKKEKKDKDDDDDK